MAKRNKWSCGMRIWLENDGEVVLGRGRVALLEAIDEHHSIRQAAASVGMSYRRAWLLVKSMNDAAPQPVVEASTGGAKGGGTRLTPYGRSTVEIYRQLDAAVRQTTERFLKSL
ncbi:MAG: winged helix-turn-helix domain-containing protein [Pirellulales bacterium]|nr:winged helix-turn-helix domain-containing protein [Pirellulales bacterium]